MWDREEIRPRYGQVRPVLFVGESQLSMASLAVQTSHVNFQSGHHFIQSGTPPNRASKFFPSTSMPVSVLNLRRTERDGEFGILVRGANPECRGGFIVHIAIRVWAVALCHGAVSSE